MRRILISLAKLLVPGWLHPTPPILVFEAVQVRPLISNTGNAVHTLSNNCRTDQLLQTFKVCRFDLKRVKITVLYRRWSPRRCPCSVRKEQSVTPVPLTPLLCFVLFAWKGSLFERPGHKSTPLDIEAFATMLWNF